MHERGRIYHYIRANTGAGFPRRLVFVDVESRQDWRSGDGKEHTQRFRIAVGQYAEWNGEAWQADLPCRFADPDAYWDWLDCQLHKRDTTWLFAHNAKVDMTWLGLWDRIGAGWCEVTGHILGDPPLCLWLRRRGCRLRVVDSMNYVRLPLSAIGEKLGVPKGQWQGWDTPDAELAAYCEQDVTVLRTAVCQMLDWWREGERGRWAATSAGLAWNAWRHRYLQAPVLVHDDGDVTSLERDAYHAGRTEAFRVGEIGGPVYHYDVNSMYPFVMRKGLFPCALKRSGLWDEPRSFDAEHDPIRCVATVRLETDRPDYPVRVGGYTVWPSGRFVTTLAGPELATAFAAGHVRKVYQWAEYELADLFSSYVDDLYVRKVSAREEGDEWSVELYKLLLNSLYGKFAQRTSDWEDYPEAKASDPWEEFFWSPAGGGPPEWCRAVGWDTQRKVSTREWAHSFPAISAWVASWGRVYLGALIEAAGRENTYYVGTDSLIVNWNGMDRLGKTGCLDPNELGKLRLVSTGHRLTVWGERRYEIDDRPHVSGIRGKAERLGKDSWKQEEWQGLRSILLSHDRQSVSVKERIVTVGSAYRKGRVGPGGVVSPLVFPDDERRFKNA